MKFNIHGSKVKVTPSIKSYIEEKIGKLDKYFEDPESIAANVVVRVRGVDQIVEVTIPVKKAILRNEEANSDLYAAIDLVSDKLERQIRKNKTRMKKKAKTIDYGFADFDIAKDETDTNKIVKRKVIDNKPMSEEEAILQMNLLGHEFFVFENIDSHTTSVLYRRKDGNYGLIDIK